MLKDHGAYKGNAYAGGAGGVNYVDYDEIVLFTNPEFIR